MSSSTDFKLTHYRRLQHGGAPFRNVPMSNGAEWMPETPQFSRRSIVSACNLLAGSIDNHSEFNRIVLELGVGGAVPTGKRPGLTLQDKANALVKHLDVNPHARTDNEFLADAVVRKAASMPFSHANECFVRALARDGFALSEDGEVRRTLPSVANLPEAEDETHTLLKELGLTTASEHLNQAIDNHARGQWAAANGELRKVLESLFDEIAEMLDPHHAANTHKGQARRDLLGRIDPPFLREELGEWSADGKNFVNGVFKRLHPEGGHPGRSDEEDCTFRLHLVLIVARYFLRRMRSLGARAAV